MAHEKCYKCDKRRKLLGKYHKICRICYRKKIIKPGGNKVVDDFIRYMRTSHSKNVIGFVPYDRFRDLELFAEGGFSKIYKATIIWNYGNRKREGCGTVALKSLKDSENITPEDLNELKIFCALRSSRKYYLNDSRSCYINNYYGITQDPKTKDFMIIMDFYNSGDLRKYITTHFEDSWYEKLNVLLSIINGLNYIHSSKIIHRDLHSGNILYNDVLSAIICDLGISKSSTTTSMDNDNEIYGIIPYVSPEVYRRQNYTTASDIYSFGMIMWEFMTGRRPFWDKIHDTELIIDICDGIRPPIVANGPEGYVDLMKKCWHPDPNARPTAKHILKKLKRIKLIESKKPTTIELSSDVGPITTNNPGAIYKSRSLSLMINSAMSTRSLKSQFITSETSELAFKDI